MEEEKLFNRRKYLLQLSLLGGNSVERSIYMLATIFHVPDADQLTGDDIEYLRNYMLRCKNNYRVNLDGVFFDSTPFTELVSYNGISSDKYLLFMKRMTGCDAFDLIGFDYYSHFEGFVQPCEIERIKNCVREAWNNVYAPIKKGDFVRSINASDPVCMYRVSAVKNDPLNASRTLIESDLCIFDDGVTLFGDGIHQVSPKEFPISTLARVPFKDAESKLKSIWNLIYNNNE